MFEYTSEGKLQRTYIGDINFEDEDLMPGEERIATVRFLLVKEVEQYLTKGRNGGYMKDLNLLVKRRFYRRIFDFGFTPVFK